MRFLDYVDKVASCLVVEICIDEYLWSVYERTPKIDMNKVEEQTKGPLEQCRYRA